MTTSPRIRTLTGNEPDEMTLTTQEAARLLKTTPAKVAQMLASRTICNGWRTGDDNNSGHWRVQLKQIKPLMPRQASTAHRTPQPRQAPDNTPGRTRSLDSPLPRSTAALCKGCGLFVCIGLEVYVNNHWIRYVRRKQSSHAPFALVALTIKIPLELIAGLLKIRMLAAKPSAQAGHHGGAEKHDQADDGHVLEIELNHSVLNAGRMLNLSWCSAPQIKAWGNRRHSDCAPRIRASPPVHVAWRARAPAAPRAKLCFRPDRPPDRRAPK